LLKKGHLSHVQKNHKRPMERHLCRDALLATLIAVDCVDAVTLTLVEASWVFLMASFLRAV
jgi:hypothetical protein